jgi:hypothetical protein
MLFAAGLARNVRPGSIEGEARVNPQEQRIDLVEAAPQRNLATAIREVTVRRPSQPDQWFDPGYPFGVQAEERVFLNTLGRHGSRNLAGCTILDVGCGFWILAAPLLGMGRFTA